MIRPVDPPDPASRLDEIMAARMGEHIARALTGDSKPLVEELAGLAGQLLVWRNEFGAQGDARMAGVCAALVQLAAGLACLADLTGRSLTGTELNP